MAATIQSSIHALFSTLITLITTLCLALLGSSMVWANPMPVDEQSLDNGAYLYDLYCSDCHGVSTVAPDSGWNSGSNAQQPYDYSELIDLAQEQKLAAAKKDEHEWPAWYKKPEADFDDTDSSVRSQVIDEITRVIDDAYGIESEAVPDTDESGSSESLPQDLENSVFSPVPGVINLADPSAYNYGTSEEAIFDSIANGTGAAMPGWRIELGSDEAVWDLVNYIRSFWGEEWQY